MVGTNCEKVIVIPARLESKRLERKLLLEDDAGKTLLQHTYEAAMQSQLADHVFIATDSNEIADQANDFIVKGYRGRLVMTDECATGTHRCREAIRSIDHLEYDINLDNLLVLNWQADEPSFDSSIADAMFMRVMHTKEPLTVAAPLKCKDGDNGSVVKIATTKERGLSHAIHYSRAYMEGAKHHVGIYCHTWHSLETFCLAPQTHIGKIAGLEQLRTAVIDPMEVLPIKEAPLAINTQEDWEEFKSMRKSKERENFGVCMAKAWWTNPMAPRKIDIEDEETNHRMQLPPVISSTGEAEDESESSESHHTSSSSSRKLGSTH